MKKLSSIILASVVLVGCNQHHAPINSNIPDPEGKVVLDDTEYMMELGEYEWKQKNVEKRKLTPVSVEELAEIFDTLEVTKDSTIKIEIEESPPTISVNQWNEDKSVEDVKVTNNEITLPSTAGYFIYEIIAEWGKKGRITYVFDVNVS